MLSSSLLLLALTLPLRHLIGWWRQKKFVKVIVACPHHLPKLPKSTLRKQARPNNGSLFCSHCVKYTTCISRYQMSFWWVKSDLTVIDLLHSAPSASSALFTLTSFKLCLVKSQTNWQFEAAGAGSESYFVEIVCTMAHYPPSQPRITAQLLGDPAQSAIIIMVHLRPWVCAAQVSEES
jgi:hypothetical protein